MAAVNTYQLYMRGPKPRCEYCGKASFKTLELAKLMVDQHPELQRAYKCDYKDTYHVTKQKTYPHNHSNKYNVPVRQFEPAQLMKEFNTDMGTGKSSTLGNHILAFMRGEYKNKGVNKFSTIMVTDHIQTIKKSWTKQHVMSEISHLKRDGVIINLDKIPDGRGAVYFTLASILEKETAPTTPPVAIPAQTTKTSSLDGNNVMTETKQQAATPATTANPFNKVNTQLEQIIAQLNGLAQGYSELANKPTIWDVSNFNTTQIDTLKSEIEALILKANANVSENFQTHMNHLFSAVEGSDDYKRGLKDGIRLASEMGLTVTKE